MGWLPIGEEVRETDRNKKKITFTLHALPLKDKQLSVLEGRREEPPAGALNYAQTTAHPKPREKKEKRKKK
jgi:hypothetical protein